MALSRTSRGFRKKKASSNAWPLAIEAFSESKSSPVSHRVGSVFTPHGRARRDQILAISKQGAVGGMWKVLLK